MRGRFAAPAFGRTKFKTKGAGKERLEEIKLAPRGNHNETTKIHGRTEAKCRGPETVQEIRPATGTSPAVQSTQKADK
jgi:hypothetical protein